MERLEIRYASRPRQKGAEPKKSIYAITVYSKNNGNMINNYVTIKMNLNRPTRPYLTAENLATQSEDNSD
jgi:hypothetical protein